MSRRREIVRRAAEVFDRQGVANTSIEDIAKAVGIKREGVYYYFKSRGDILLEVILPSSKSLTLNMKSVMRADMDCMEKLHGAIQTHLNAFNPTYLEMSVALREEHFFRNDAKLSELRRSWDEYSRLWVELIEEGQKNGEFKPNLKPKMVAYAYIGMCNWLARWYDPAKDVPIPELIETYFTLASSGIGVDAPKPE